jgi:hypothetical protein
VGEYVLPAGQPAWVALAHIQRNDPRWVSSTRLLQSSHAALSQLAAPRGAAIAHAGRRLECILAGHITTHTRHAYYPQRFLASLCLSGASCVSRTPLTCIA